ncbi:MAG: hypothetical protein ACKO0V_10635, partial [bacterium]
MNRRDFMKLMSVSAISGMGRVIADEALKSGKFPPTRQITRGPKYHWFGYYDKLQFSTDHKLVLCNQVSFENRRPGPDDEIAVGMIDIGHGDKWVELGTSRAWNWQQGCMLQWLPGSDREVIWNDREGDHYVCH